MSNPPVMSYPLDLTGRSPDNLVLGETHGPCYPGNRVFVLSYGPFYAKSLVVRKKATGEILVPNVDYKAVHTFIEPTLRTGYLVCSIIQIEATAYGIELECDYQVLGGDYSLSTSALENLVDDLNNDDRAVRWGEIIGKPEAYPPTPHLHDIYDTFGWQYVVAALEAIRQALLMGSAGNNDDLYAYVDLKHSQAMSAVNDVQTNLNAHINDFNNPHHLTKAQIGLSLVGNYPLATPEIARLNLSNNTLLSPYLAKFANEYHTLDFDNPHQVTKDQTGLGNVDNYVTADLEKALAGVDNQSFLTPYGAAAMIAQALTLNPPAPKTAPKASFTQTTTVVAGGDYSIATNFINNNVTYNDLVGIPANTTWSVSVTSTATAGSSAIVTREWLLTSSNDPGINATSTGNTYTFDVAITNPHENGVYADALRTVKHTVTDANGLTHYTSTVFTFHVQIYAAPPPRIDAYELTSGFEFIRVNGYRLAHNYYGNSGFWGYTERFQDILAADVGQNRTHSFTVDIDPYWSDWTGGGDSRGVNKATHVTTWTISNDTTTHSAHVYMSNYAALSATYNVVVATAENGGWVAIKNAVTVTSLVTNLSTMKEFIVDARNSLTYVAPTAEFNLTDGSLTVTSPTVLDLKFTDQSVSNVAGNPITQIEWLFNVGRELNGESNSIPGSWLHWTGTSDVSPFTPFPVGTTSLSVTLQAKTATSSWVSKTRTYSLVTNPKPPDPPIANFGMTYTLTPGQPYIPPPGQTPVVVTLNAGQGANGGGKPNGSIPGDPAYPIVSYNWALVFANGNTVNLTGKTPPPYNTTVVYTAGQYELIVKLTVVDAYGHSATKTFNYGMPNDNNS